jgi:hypothetical protein
VQPGAGDSVPIPGFGAVFKLTSQTTGGLVAIGQTLFLGGPAGASGVYNLSGGVLSVHQIAKGAAGGAFNFTGGVLHADEVGFDLINEGGVLAPGNSPGATHVAGALTLQSGSVQIELASATDFDHVNVDGLLTLGGMLDVQLLDGYLPQPDTRWLIMTGGSIHGHFDSITNGFALEQSGGSLYLVAVPEPAGLFLAALGTLGLLRRRRLIRS